MTEEKNKDDDAMFWDDDDEDTQANKYLLFHLNEEIYGISIAPVINIIELQKITEVPDMPQAVRGVINLRGSIIPVMDLRLRFSLPEREYDDRTCIIIVRVGTKSVGLICDTVAEVHTILPEAIEPAINFKNDVGNRPIAGLAKIGDGVRILLDVEKIIDEDALRISA